MSSDGARDDHGDDGDDHKMIKCSTWKRRKRKTKSYEDQGKGISQDFSFSDQDIIEGVITFRIGSHTIKKEILWPSSYQVPLGDIVHVHAFKTQCANLTLENDYENANTHA